MALSTNAEPHAGEPPLGSPWSLNPRRLLIVGAAAFALLGLVALASAIDLPASDRSDAAQQSIDQGSGSGFDSEGRVDLGDNGAVDIRPIPGCPDGFSIGEDIYVVPDPEACGFRPIAPGERGFDSSGKILLVPDIDGDVGGIRIGPDGEVQLLPPGVLGPDDFAIGQSPDGSFGLVRPDGSRVEIVPGDDGLSLRDPERGGSQFFDGDDPFGQGVPFDSSPDLPPGAAQQDPTQQNPGQLNPGQLNPGQPDSAQSDADDPDADTDWSFLGPVLIIVLAAAVLAFLFMALRQTGWGKEEPLEDAGTDGPMQDTLVDYSTEIGALDRLLWEIDQEADPRTAIRRVYAALETGLDNPAMARRRSETPGMYLRRLLGHFTSLDGPMRELTDLFEQARFSDHQITPEMRDRAVVILVAVRGHYAQASEQRDHRPPQPVLA